MSEEDFGMIPLNPYKLMSKYLRLNKAAYIKDRLLRVTGDFIKEQGLTEEYAAFLEAWSQCYKERVLSMTLGPPTPAEIRERIIERDRELLEKLNTGSKKVRSSNRRTKND